MSVNQSRLCYILYYIYFSNFLCFSCSLLKYTETHCHDTFFHCYKQSRELCNQFLVTTRNNCPWLALHFPAFCQQRERQYVVFLFCLVSWEMKSLVRARSPNPLHPSVPSLLPVIYTLHASSWKQPAWLGGGVNGVIDGVIVVYEQEEEEHRER